MRHKNSAACLSIIILGLFSSSYAQDKPATKSSPAFFTDTIKTRIENAQIVLGLRPDEILKSPEMVIFDTKFGEIVGCAPQVAFDAALWKSSFMMPRHMLLDLLSEKRLLGKTEKDLEGLFFEKSKNENSTDYFLSKCIKCGNEPKLVLEVGFDSANKVCRYRSNYFPDGGTANSIASNWIE